MFELFTDRARRVVVLAQEEARSLEHDYIGTEHLLLGLLAQPDGIPVTTRIAYCGACGRTIGILPRGRFAGQPGLLGRAGRQPDDPSSGGTRTPTSSR